MRKILSSNKIFFRIVEEDDLEKRVEWINDPDVQQFLHYDYPTSLSRTKKWFEKIALDKTRVDFSIFNKKPKKYIGFCGFINVDMVVKKAEMYAVIGEKDYWGGGYGTEIYKLLTNYGFQELGLNRIYGYQDIENKAPQIICQKIGWSVEGCLRQDNFVHGKLYDRIIVSILRTEWGKNSSYDF